MRILGAVLLALGVLAVVYGGFWYMKEETKAEIGPLKLKVEERERVNVPVWAGVGGIVVGALALTASRRRG